MSPMYNPDDWSEEFNIKLKYDPMSESSVNRILNQYKHDDILDYIKELWNLIDYQRKLISDYNKEIVSFKHKEAWKRYDLSDEKFKDSVDKPPKSGNMSC
jgi:uncharacterized membrane-anchored protein YjiN (DUF445 family)